MQKQINNIKNFFKSLTKNIKPINIDESKDLNLSISFVLTLISIYLCFNRFLESVIILFTGCATSYFSTFSHLLSLSVITIAYFTAIESKNVKHKINDNTKLNIFHFYAWIFIIYSVSMTVEIVNKHMIKMYFYQNNLIENIFLLKPALITTALATSYLMYFGIYLLYKKYVLRNRKNIYNLVHAKGISFSKNIKEKKDTTSITSDKSIYYFGNNNLLTFETKDLLKHLVVFGNNELKYKYVFEPLFMLQVKRRQNYLNKANEVLNKLIKENICTLKSNYTEMDLNNGLTFNMVKPTKGMELDFKKKTTDITTIDGLTQKSIGLIYIAEEYNNFKDLIYKVNKNQQAEVIGFKEVSKKEYKNITFKGLNPLAHDSYKEVKYNTLKLIQDILKSNNQSLIYEETNVFLENVISLLYLTYPIKEKNEYPDMNNLLSLLQNLNFLKILNTELKEKFLDKQIFLSKDEIEIYQNTYLYFENEVFKSNISNDSESLQQKIFRDILTVTKLINSFLSSKDVCNIFLNKDKSVDLNNIFKDSKILLIYIDKENRMLSNTMYSYINSLIESATKDREKQTMTNTLYIYFEDFSNILYSNDFNVNFLHTYTENTVSGIFGLKDTISNPITNNSSTFLREVDSGIHIINKNVSEANLLNALTTLKIDQNKSLDIKNRSDIFAIYNIVSKGKRIKGFEDLNTNEKVKPKIQEKETTSTTNLSDNIAVLLKDMEEDEFKKIYNKTNKKKKNYTKKSRNKKTNTKNANTNK